MDTEILLIRHGQTNSNLTGYYMGWAEEDMNETGYRQARRLSERLADSSITAIYTSPLKRAMATAQIIGAPHKLEPRLNPDLIEINIGEWRGLDAEVIKQRFPQVWHQWRTDPSGVVMPGGESVAQVTKRAICAFEEIVKDNQGKLSAIVTHDIVVKIVICHILGVSNKVHRRFDISNASLTRIRIPEGGPRISTMNDISHLRNPILDGEKM